MKYISTRGAAPALDFEEALLTGLARDGGLYVPDQWPHFSTDEIAALAGLPYAELAVRVMAPFVGDSIGRDDLAAITADAYAGFGHKAVAPLKQIDSNLWLMELFHGPTLAFKDYALQLVGRLFDYVLAKRGRRLTIVGATSGDTGSAAIEACRDREAIDVFILHPKGRVSEVQRRQMTCVPSANVHNIAIEGSFDDCQDLLKALFNDHEFRDRVSLGAVNSINWARVMGQIVFYFYAALALGAPARRVSFSVPSGNFGNIFSGYGAHRMGLPVGRLISASNRNDILARFFDSGTLETRPVEPTLSPSMDIQVSSNLERLLFDAFGRDGGVLAGEMEAFRATGHMKLDAARWQEIRTLFDGFRLDDDGIKATIRRVYGETGELLDPHSAIGVAAAVAQAGDPDVPTVCLATAHPAKFPDAVEAACGMRPALPPRLADLYEREERCVTLPNNLQSLREFIDARVSQ